MSFIKKHSHIILLLIIVGITSVFVSPMFVPLPDRDSGVFLYIGKQILSGEVPYQDIWDHKGPILYFINALGVLISPGSQWGIWLVESLLLSFASVISYKVGKKIFGKDVAILGSLFWITSLPLIRKANLSENYYLVIQILIIYLFYKTQEKEHRKKYYFGIGVLSAIGFLIRPNLIGVPIAIGLIWLGQLLFDKKGKDFLKKIGPTFSGAASLFGVVSLYLIANNTFTDFVDQAFRFNFLYIDAQQITLSGYLNFVNGNLPFILPIAMLGWLVLLIDLISGPSDNQDSNKLIKILILISFPIEIYLSGLSGRIHTHYLVTWLVPMALLAGSFFSTLISNFPKKKIFKTNISMNLAIILILDLFLVFFTLTMHYREISTSVSYFIDNQKLYISDLNNESKEIIDCLNQKSSSDDTVLFWGNELTYNFLTNRETPSRFSNIQTFTNTNYIDEAMLAEFMDDILENKPLIIDTSPTNSNTPALLGEAGKYPSVELIKKFIQSNYIQSDLIASNGWIVYEFDDNGEN